MHSMDLAYLAADLVISRAGAMTCYEILAHGKPSILVFSFFIFKLVLIYEHGMKNIVSFV